MIRTALARANARPSHATTHGQRTTSHGHRTRTRPHARQARRQTSAAPAEKYKTHAKNKPHGTRHTSHVNTADARTETRRRDSAALPSSHTQRPTPHAPNLRTRIHLSNERLDTRVASRSARTCTCAARACALAAATKPPPPAPAPPAAPPPRRRAPHRAAAATGDRGTTPPSACPSAVHSSAPDAPAVSAARASASRIPPHGPPAPHHANGQSSASSPLSRPPLLATAAQPSVPTSCTAPRGSPVALAQPLLPPLYRHPPAIRALCVSMQPCGSSTRPSPPPRGVGLPLSFLHGGGGRFRTANPELPTLSPMPSQLHAPSRVYLVGALSHPKGEGCSKAERLRWGHTPDLPSEASLAELVWEARGHRHARGPVPQVGGGSSD